MRRPPSRCDRGRGGCAHAGALPGDGSTASVARFKAQSRLWGFNATTANRLDELTSILIDAESPVDDKSGTKDVSPLESQRSWEHQAEENILSRLQKGGLLAPAGPVDDVLNTVVNNLIVSSNLNVEAHCRVLLTTPVEALKDGICRFAAARMPHSAGISGLTCHMRACNMRACHHPRSPTPTRLRPMSPLRRSGRWGRKTAAER